MRLNSYKKYFIVLAMSFIVTSCTTNKTEYTLKVEGEALEKTPTLPAALEGVSLNDKASPVAVSKINKKLFQTGSMKRMSLSFVATKMLETNPDIEIFEARAEQAKYGVEVSVAKLRPNLTLKMSGASENTYATSGATIQSPRREASFVINTTLFDFGKRDKDIAQSKSAYDAAKLRAKDKTDKVFLNLTNAYLDVLETRELARVTNKNILQIYKFKNLVKANQEEGNASVADLKRVEARLENANAVFVDLKSNYETSRENFKKITDFYPVNLQAPPRLNTYEKANFANAEFALKGSKFSLQAIRKDIEGLNNKLSSIKASVLPVVKIAGIANFKENVGGLNDPMTDYRINLSLKYKLYDGGVAVAQQKRIQAQIREGKALLRKKSKDFEQDMRNADLDQTASAKKNALLAKRLAASRKVVELNTEQFKEGVLTIFELLDAQAQLLSAHQDQIKNRYKKYRVRYKQLQLADRLRSSLVKED